MKTIFLYFVFALCLFSCSQLKKGDDSSASSITTDEHFTDITGVYSLDKYFTTGGETISGQQASCEIPSEEDYDSFKGSAFFELGLMKGISGQIVTFPCTTSKDCNETNAISWRGNLLTHTGSTWTGLLGNAVFYVDDKGCYNAYGTVSADLKNDSLSMIVKTYSEISSTSKNGCKITSDFESRKKNFKCTGVQKILATRVKS